MSFNALVWGVDRMKFNFYDVIGTYILAAALILVAVIYYAEFKATRNPLS